jgi:hypothetical protein
MATEREKLIRDINGLKESVRLAWLEMASQPMTSAERQELVKHIDLRVYGPSSISRPKRRRSSALGHTRSISVITLWGRCAAKATHPRRGAPDCD